MTADDVLTVVALLREGETDIWVGGGWGIDALLGEQTRDHRDLDLMHRQEQEAAVVRALADAGFTETVNWLSCGGCSGSPRTSDPWSTPSASPR